jgi:hypothetical protein
MIGSLSATIPLACSSDCVSSSSASPAVRDLVVHEQVADALRLLRPAMTDETGNVAACLRGDRRSARHRGVPVLEQVVEHGEEALLGRVPWLHQVVVEADLVDRADRDLCVGVRGQEDAACRRGYVGGLREELDAGDLRHALVGEQEGDRVAAYGQPAQQLEALGA